MIQSADSKRNVEAYEKMVRSKYEEELKSADMGRLRTISETIVERLQTNLEKIAKEDIRPRVQRIRLVYLLEES